MGRDSGLGPPPLPPLTARRDQEETCLRMPAVGENRACLMCSVWAPSWAPREREEASVETKATCLRKHLPEGTQEPSILADPVESLWEGRWMGTSAGVMWEPPSRGSSGPCTCAHPGPPGSPGSAQHSTSGTYTRTWSSG